MRINTDRYVSTRTMGWTINDRVLVTEASDIGVDPYRLYDDDFGYGLWVKSHTTGHLVPFDYSGPEYDEEGELVSWRFSNTEHKVTLIVLND